MEGDWRFKDTRNARILAMEGLFTGGGLGISD